MVGPEKHARNLAIVCGAETAESDDEIIREELARRSEFDRQHTRAMSRLFLRPEARDEDQAWQRQRIAADAAQEAARRMAFDEKYPGIYKSPEEERRAYLIFHPGSILKRLIDLNAFESAR